MGENGCSFKGDGSKCEAAHYYLLNKEEEPNGKRKKERMYECTSWTVRDSGGQRWKVKVKAKVMKIEVRFWNCAIDGMNVQRAMFSRPFFCPKSQPMGGDAFV